MKTLIMGQWQGQGNELLGVLSCQLLDDGATRIAEIEHFGGKEYRVTAIPANLYGLNDRELLTDILDNLVNENERMAKAAIKDRIATMSCKAAVKGNNKLSFEEAKALIAELLELDNPFNCPHGRPTIISMSKYEIEKKFRRIV